MVLEWFRDKLSKPVPTELEQQYQIKRILKKWPLGNQELWFTVLSEAGGTTMDIVEAIIVEFQHYKEAFPTDNPPISAHLERVGFRAKPNPLLEHTAFNYDYVLGGNKRLHFALEDLKAHKRSSVVYNDREYESVNQQVSRELDVMRILRGITIENKFNPRTQTEQVVLQLVERSMLLELQDPMLEDYKKYVLPYLEPHQVLKPAPTYGMSFGPFEPAQIFRVSL